MYSVHQDVNLPGCYFYVFLDMVLFIHSFFKVRLKNGAVIPSIVDVDVDCRVAMILTLLSQRYRMSGTFDNSSFSCAGILDSLATPKTAINFELSDVAAWHATRTDILHVPE